MKAWHWAALFVLAAVSAADSAVARKPEIATSQWPQWRGPHQDGHSPDTLLLSDWNKQAPKLLWKSKGLGSGYASLSIVGGRIYTTGDQESSQNVTAVDAKDGSVIWSTPMTDKVPKYDKSGSRSQPTIDGDRLYAIASSGKIVCLSTKDGKPVWQRDFSEWKGKMMSQWGFSESPLVDGDLVVCTPGGPDATLVALNKMTGKEVWKTATPDLGQSGKDGAGYSSVVISNGAGVKQYVQLVGRGLIGVRAKDGKLLWNYNRVANGVANIPTPIISGDDVFASTSYGNGAALVHLTASGEDVKAEEVYYLENGTFNNHHGGMVLVNGYVYGGHGQNQGFPTCVELKTGKIAWQKKDRGPFSGSAAVLFADGNVIFRYQNGMVALVEATPEEFRLKGSFKPEIVHEPSWAHPVVLGGKLYLRDEDDLMCYDDSAK